MFDKLLAICHCERATRLVEKQSQDFEITSLRCRDLRNDKCLTEHDMDSG